MASTVARTAHVSESDVVQSTSESPGIASADSQYSNSRSSSPDHPKSDPEQDASAQVDHRRCLWSDSHQLKSLEDIQCHIFGCVPFRDRIKVLRDMEKPNGFWHKALELDLEQHPDVPWMKSKPAMKAKQRLEFIRYLAVLGIKGERKRIRIIRSEIKKRGDKKGLPDDKNGLSDDNNGSKGLFEFVASSLHAWRHSDEYNNGLIWVREWRAKHDKTSIGESLGPKETKAKKAVADEEADEADEADTRFADELSRIKREYQKQYVTQDRDTAPRDHGIAKDSSPKAVKLYDLERDVKVHILQFEPIPTERPGAPSTGTDNDIDPELDGLMQPYQEQGGLLHKEVYKEQFPNQVISVESFLTNEFKQMTPNGRGPRSPGGGDDAGGGDDPGGGSDPGSGPDGGDEQSRRFRWFHIPYNNMEWVEQAVMGYFGKGDSAKKAAGMVLHPERWKGQEYGSGTEAVVHSRHLRTLCDRFSTDLKKSYSDKRRNNMVLFMPYLHWETDRNRTRMAEAVRKQVDRDTQEDRDKRSKDKSRQRRERGLPLPHLPRPMHTDPDHYKRPKSGADVIPETVEGIL